MTKFVVFSRERGEKWSSIGSFVIELKAKQFVAQNLILDKQIGMKKFYKIKRKSLGL